MSSRLAFVVVAAIGLWMLRKNGRVLFAYATELTSKDVSRVRSLALGQWLIDKLTAATTTFARFLDARILNGHLLRIRRPRTVYILSRTLTGARSFTDRRSANPAVVDISSTQPMNAIKTVIALIVTIGIRAARSLTDTLN